MPRPTSVLAVAAPLLAVQLLAAGCTADVDGMSMDNGEEPLASGVGHIASVNKTPRYVAIRNAAAARGMRNAYLLAGIANDETNLAMCWSEATWACQGPSSPECGGGPVIAGSADGPCGNQQGGLGMFQFDAGTYSDTINRYGNGILTVDGQIAAAIDYSIWMVKVSPYTTNAETDAKARAWINNYDPNNATLRNQWLSTVVRYYNGCQPGWSCWNARYQTYSDGYFAAINDPGGLGFWGAAAGTTCDGSPATVGEIDAKYRALGGCGSFLGKPITGETGAPDNVGRYSVFENGSIYWTPSTGAFEVHGRIRDKWKDLNWEIGYGYPLTDETTPPDGVGRYSVFQGGSIYWSPSTDAHEVHGVIRDKYKELGWEAGQLGYPTSDEYAVTDGRRSDFQHGSITFSTKTNTATVSYTSTAP